MLNIAAEHSDALADAATHRPDLPADGLDPVTNGLAGAREILSDRRGLAHRPGLLVESRGAVGQVSTGFCQRQPHAHTLTKDQLKDGWGRLVLAVLDGIHSRHGRLHRFGSGVNACRDCRCG